MRIPSSKIFFTFSGILALIAILIFLHQRKLISPVESAVVELPRPLVFVLSRTGQSVKSFFGYFSAVGSVNRRNAELTSKIRDLQQQNVELQQYRLENETLRKELQFRSANKLDLISATVIERDPTGLGQTLILAAGSRDGVKEGQAVLSEGVFVGTIISAETFTSKMRLLIDPQSNIEAAISNSGDNGILRGSYGSGMVLDMISQNTQIIKDDQVVTAGLTSGIPKGLLIGNIGELQSQKNDLLQKATVVSTVNIRNLYFVSIIKQ